MRRRGLAAGGGLAVIGGIAALAGACSTQIQLGDPRDTDAGMDDGPSPPVCTGTLTRTVLADAAVALGELRALAVSSDQLYVLSSRDGTGEGVLSRISASGAAHAADLTPVASVGFDPSALAVSDDGAFVFTATRGSAQVFRVDRNQTAIVTGASGAVGGVVASRINGGAYWTIPTDDSVLGWDFAIGAPVPFATSPRATSLLRVGNAIYVTGNRSLRSFEPDGDRAVRLLAERCDTGIPAIADNVLYCADDGTIARVDLTAGTASIAAAAQPGATDVVIVAGRAFWRTAPDPTQTALMALPLDGIGGATVLESSAPGPLLLTRDGCTLYFTAGRSLVRLAL